jgi:1,2-phenylacetyl-CoA epoxidase catalytic subunit
VAANYVIDGMLTRVMESLAGSAFRPLRGGLDKMIEEERFHAHHARGWLRTLARAGGDDAARLGQCLTAALASAVAWLGPEDERDDGALLAAGVKRRRSAELARDLVAQVGAECREAGLELAPPGASFAGWSVALRRAGTGGPDAEILEHLRGTRNAVFKVA